jgi:hypothetical protein
MFLTLKLKLGLRQKILIRQMDSNSCHKKSSVRGKLRGIHPWEGNDAGGFNHREPFRPLHGDCLAWCTFVMYFRWDNYHFKLYNPVRIIVTHCCV